VQDFRRLDVWQAAQLLAVAVHGATRRLTGPDSAGLRAQMRSSAQSIGANIAEGASAGGAVQFARYLQMAIGSASETESHLDLAARLRLLDGDDSIRLQEDVVRIRRRLIALRKRVLEASAYPRTRNPNPPPTN